MADIEALTGTGEFSRDGWQAYASPGPRKRTQSSDTSRIYHSWDYEKAGLVAQGPAENYQGVEHAIAKTSDNLEVIVDVTPMSYGGGTKTIFALTPEISSLIFPKPQRRI